MRQEIASYLQYHSPWAFEENKKSKKNHEKIPPHRKNTPRNPHQTVDRDYLETTREKRVPRLSTPSPASIDPGFVEIGLVHLSQ